MPRWRLFLRRLLQTSAVDRDREENDLKDEIAFHLKEETERRIAVGQSTADAAASAARAFGNMPLIEDITRDTWGWTTAAERLMQDVRFALRTLARDRASTIVACVTLALGMAATVSVFAVTKAVLLDPLPYPDPDRLVMVWERTPQGDPKNLVSRFNFVNWRLRNQVFDSLGAIAQVPLNITGLGDAEQVDGLAVTAEFFDALGVRPVLGRTIGAGEDLIGGRRTVVLSYGFWSQRFGGAGDAIGRLLAINGFPHEIVGVMPASFAFPVARAAELYIPIQIDPTAPPGGRNLITVARLKAGVSLEMARLDMQRVASELAREQPSVNAGYGTSIAPLREEAVGSISRMLWVVFGAVACLFLLACANVANLLLMRASKRAPEIAVRVALGAGRWRLAHQLAVESLVLTCGAGAIGLAFAWLGVPLIPSLFPPSFPLPRAAEIAIDGRVLGFALLVSVGIGLFFSLLPATRTSEDHLADPLRSSARALFGFHARARRSLVVLEVAIALVLVLAAALMGRSFAALSRVQPGFEADRILTLQMLLIPSKYRNPSQRASFVQAVVAQVRSTPGIVSASSIHFLPLSGLGSSTVFYRRDRPAPALTDRSGGPVSVISDGYFSTLGIALYGRDFNSNDRVNTPRVAIVNESLAREFFPNEPSIGKHLAVGWSAPDQDFEIVGVSADVRTSTLDRPPGPALYIAQAQEPSSVATLVVRTPASPAVAGAAVRAAIARVDPDQGVSHVQPLESVIASATARPKLQATLLGAFGILALVIAGVGVYGVMSYGVEQRRREIGLRLALGAAPSAVIRMVLLEGFSLAAVGTAVGIPIALAFSSVLDGLLYQTRPNDAMTFAAVAAVLFVATSLATAGPAFRATRVDPLVVLREE